MDKVKNNRFLIMATVVVGVYHLLIREQILDDSYYSTILEGASLIEVLKMRYMTWSSRSLIEAVLFVLVNHMWLWKMIDTFIMVTIAYMIAKLTDNDMVPYLGLLVFPFHELSQAGWVATTVDYIWPLWCGMVICMLMKRYHKDTGYQSVKWYHYLYSIPVVLFACNQELMALVMVVLTVWSGVVLILKNRRGLVYHLLMLGLEATSLAYIFVCPGNINRTVQSIIEFAPEYKDYSLPYKLFLGLYNIERVFISKPQILFITMIVLLAILAVRNFNKMIDKLIASIPVMIVIGHTILGPAMKGWNIVFHEAPKTFEKSEMGMYRYWALIYIIITGMSIIYTLVKLQVANADDTIMIFTTLIVLAAGFGTAFAMGLSPTLYASGERIFTFMYFSMIYGVSVVTRDKKSLWNGNERSLKDRLSFSTAVMFLWILANVINEMGSVIV